MGYSRELRRIVYCTVLYCNVLYFTVLYCKSAFSSAFFYLKKVTTFFKELVVGKSHRSVDLHYYPSFSAKHKCEKSGQYSPAKRS